MRLGVPRWTLARSRVNLTFAHPAPGLQEGLVYRSDGVERMVWERMHQVSQACGGGHRAPGGKGVPTYQALPRVRRSGW